MPLAVWLVVRLMQVIQKNYVPRNMAFINRVASGIARVTRWLSLATAPILGQPPRVSRSNKRK